MSFLKLTLILKPRWQVILRGIWLCLSLSFIHQSAHAQTHRFEQSSDGLSLGAPSVLTEESPIQADSAVEEAVQDKALLQISEKDLNKHPRVMAQMIEQLIKQQQWGLLGAVLEKYEVHPQADPYLVLYAKGTLHRHRKNYYLAIGAFQALLHLQPELTYIRLDLAMMQIEDKQYSTAMETLEQLIRKQHTPLPIKRLAEQYLKQLRKLYAADFRFSGSYMRNDNVNQASAERSINLWGMSFMKNEDSLPKTGHGLNYGVGFRKLVAVQGHHAISLNAQYNATDYWDQKDYNERTLRLNPAYLYQNHNQWIKAGPVYEKNWLGGRQYGTRLGAQAEWGKQISARHHLIPYAEYTNKRYHSSNLERYQGNTYKTGMTWVYQPQAGTTLSMGAHYQQDALNDKAESSSTISGRAGASYRWGNGLNTQASVHAGRRHFEASHYLFGFTRSDKEFAGSIGIWHSKLSVMGITPKLVYRYSNIRSNIPALYSRKSQGFMLEMVDVVF